MAVIGFVFAALSFVGFEAAATLGDEVGSPRRVVPRAIFVSAAVVGLIYVFCVWAEVNGLGASATNRLNGASTPWNDLASAYATWMKWPVIIAAVSSMFAVMINSSNGLIRILHAMARDPALRCNGFRNSLDLGRRSRQQCDLRAFLGLRQRNRSADPAAGSGDDGDFAGEFHVTTSFQRTMAAMSLLGDAPAA